MARIGPKAVERVFYWRFVIEDSNVCIRTNATPKRILHRGSEEGTMADRAVWGEETA